MHSPTNQQAHVIQLVEEAVAIHKQWDELDKTLDFDDIQSSGHKKLDELDSSIDLQMSALSREAAKLKLNAYDLVECLRLEGKKALLQKMDLWEDAA